MMKKYSNFSTICLAAMLALAACTQDELADSTTLPEGMYPLEIASVTLAVESSEQPWTRVSESEDGGSVWTAGDVFYVKFQGSEQVGTYRITDAEAGTVEAVEPVYWQSASTEQTIIAWYASQEDGTLDVSDQTGGLAYVIRAEQTATYSSGTAVSLTFAHQLAKVRVELSGLRAGKVTSVSLKNCHTQCTNSQGNVTAGSETGNIQMHKVDGQLVFEANVLPSENIATVIVNGIESTLTTSITTEASKVYEVSLQVNAEGIPADATMITIENCSNISGTGNYVVSGTFNNQITITGGSPTIYLDNASISVSGNAISITGNASPTIHVVGEHNSVTSSNGAGIYVASGSTVNITSTDRSNVLTATGGNGGSGIGACDQACGNIVITNVTVKAYGSKENAVTSVCYSAGIGGSGNNACGTITIDNAIVYAYGATDGTNYSTPGIGGGLESNTAATYGTITIKNASEVYVQRGFSYSDYIGRAGYIANPANSTDGINATVDESSTVTKLN